MPPTFAAANEKSAQRDANTACVLAVVRFGHRPPARAMQTHKQDRQQYTAQLSLVRSVIRRRRRRTLVSIDRFFTRTMPSANTYQTE